MAIILNILLHVHVVMYIDCSRPVVFSSVNLSPGLQVMYACSASGCEYFDGDKKDEKVHKGEQDHSG